MGSRHSSRISLYAFSILVLGYFFYYTGILSISLFYVVAFALILNGVGTFIYAFGAKRMFSLFISVYFFNFGIILLLMEKFRPPVTWPFFASAFMLTNAFAFLLLYIEDTKKRTNLIYTVVCLIIGSVLLTSFRRFQPIDFLLWMRNILTSFWTLFIAVLGIAAYGFFRDNN